MPARSPSARKPSTATASRHQSPVTYSKDQRVIQKEFCDAYDFAPEQVGFDGPSLDPIFDFDALSVLSTRLCNLPFVGVEHFGTNGVLQMATSNGDATLPNGNQRRIYGAAFLGETMHDGSTIDSWRQAVNVSRARALRTILRAVGFDPVAAHRSFKRTGKVIEFQASGQLTRDQERKEIHMLAESLGLLTKIAAVGAAADPQSTARTRTDRSAYEKAISTFFKGKTSSKSLNDSEHTQFLAILRSWVRARAIANAA